MSDSQRSGAVVVVSGAAYEKFSEAVRGIETPEEEYINPAVIPGGCSGFSYALSFVERTEIEEDPDAFMLLYVHEISENGDRLFFEGEPEGEVCDGDVASVDDGIVLAVDRFSEMYLRGVRIDYVDKFMSKGFAFENPNATGDCGCGSSFAV